MKAPTELRFGGQIWKVVQKSGMVGKKKKPLLGECVYEKTTIHVEPKQSLDSYKSTLLHECVHAAANAMDWEAKEQTVIKIEKLIYALVKDNPGLFKWLMSKKMDCPVCGRPAGTCDCHGSYS